MSLENNKVFASVLTAGIAFMVSGLIAGAVVPTHFPAKTAIKIEGVGEPAAPAAAPATAELPPIGPLLASANPENGEKIAKSQCGSCHTFNQGGKAGVGPNLFGVVGAPHGHMEGFNYSAALKSHQGNWTYDDLNHWLAKPSAWAPGTRMAFAGIHNDKQRADVIAFLRSISPNAPAP